MLPHATLTPVLMVRRCMMKNGRSSCGTRHQPPNLRTTYQKGRRGTSARPHPHQYQIITSKPPMNTISEKPCKKNDAKPPVGNTNKENQENTRQVYKKSKVINRNANKSQVTTRNHSKAENNSKRNNTNTGETKETESRKVLIK